MNIIRTWLLAFLAVVVMASAAPVWAVQPVVYVVRHLNTPAGERDPDLLPEGQRLAQRLARYFRSDRPVAIYVTDFRRTRQTAAPLAERLHLTPIVYDPADTPGLLARVRAEHGPVLIVGHSNTVPDIVTGLGGVRPAPLVHEDFGDIWRVSPDGVTIKSRIAEN